MKKVSLELAELLDDAEIEAPTAAHVDVQTLVVERTAYSTIFQHPPSRIVWRELKLGARPILRFFPLINPAVWDRLESDIVFSLAILDEGEEKIVFECSFNPRRNKTERVPVERQIDLSRWSNRSIALKLATQSRSGGSVAYGWSGWGDCKLEHDFNECIPRRNAARKDGAPNLIVITSDALRRDHLSCYGAREVSTPNLDRLAKEGLLFERARSTTDTTFGSHCALLTGRHPVSTGVDVEWGRFPASCKSLPVWLAGRGYRTIMAASERELGNSASGLQEAFHEFVPILGNPAQHSALTVHRLLRKLERTHHEPWFIWLQLFDPHPPMVPVGAAARRKYPYDPTSPERADRTELISKVHGVETRKEFVDMPWDSSSGRLPTLVLRRLKATLLALEDPTQAGPDLASLINDLGERVMKGASRKDFLRWFRINLAKAEQERTPPAFYAWLDELSQCLSEVESSMLGWVKGVLDFRYLEALYAATVECVDEAFGELRLGLERLGVFEQSIIVFTAPHGECLGETPAVFHHHVPAEVVLKVPLIVRLPSKMGLAGKVVPDLFELIDLYPTLADLIGVPTPQDLEGRSRAVEILAGSRWADGPSLAVGMFGCFLTLYCRPYKLVKALIADQIWPWHEGPPPPDGVYLFHEADEKTNLSEREPALKNRLLARLRARLAESPHIKLATGSLFPAEVAPWGAVR